MRFLTLFFESSTWIRIQFFHQKKTLQKTWPEKQPTHRGNPSHGGQCGSCWAFGAASALDSRLCIATQGVFSGPEAQLSRGYIASCAKPNGGDGCGGGHSSYVFDLFSSGGGCREGFRVFVWFGATRRSFGLGLVWLGFAQLDRKDFFWFLPHKCTRQLPTLWKSMIGRAQISFWGQRVSERVGQRRLSSTLHNKFCHFVEKQQFFGHFVLQELNKQMCFFCQH